MIMSLNPRTWFNLLRPMPSGNGMVIVAGMPKSGTTAIAKLLGAATGLTVCSDPFYILTQMKVDFREGLFDGQLPLSTLWRRHRRVFSGTIIKDPNFSLLIPQIRKMFPDAHIVFIVRDPRDTIRSILNRLNLPGNPQGVDLDSTEIPLLWRKFLHGHDPQISGKDYVEVLARRWRMSAEAYLQYQEACILIRYEDFKKDKSTAIINLANQVGYSEAQNIEHLVNIQYQPKGNSAVCLEDFFGKEHIELIDRVTAPVLKEFGYVR